MEICIIGTYDVISNLPAREGWVPKGECPVLGYRLVTLVPHASSVLQTMHPILWKNTMAALLCH